MRGRAIGGAGCAIALLTLSACSGKGSSQDHEQSGPPTWHRDIQPLLQENCAACHREGGIAPFSLEDYESARNAAGLAVEAVEANIMPPWLAHDSEECVHELPFRDDLRLSDGQKLLLREWWEADMPLGDPADAPEPVEPPRLDIVDPTAEIAFEQPFRVSGQKDIFECFVIDPGHTEDVWVTEATMMPDNTRVAHHGIIFLDLDGVADQYAEDGHFECFNPPSVAGYILNVWVPGAVPMRPPEGTGMPMPEGARIVVQMHYHPTGVGPEMDQSTVSLKWTNEEPEYEAAAALLGNFNDLEDDGTGLQPGPSDPEDGPAFFIPAGASDHTETQIYRHEFPLDLPIFAAGTHMHYVGTDMIVEKVALGSEERTCIIQTPRWDFDWQRIYQFDVPIEELPVVKYGDEVHLRCGYDNTPSNPGVLRAMDEADLPGPVDVHLGEETLDEMCLGLFGVLLPPGLLDSGLLD